MLLKVYPAVSWVISQFEMLIVLNAFGCLVKKEKDPTEECMEPTIPLLVIVAGVHIGLVGVWHYTVDAYENIR